MHQLKVTSTRCATVYVSLLIPGGLHVVFASRHLGHANPSITLEVYARLLQRADYEHSAGMRSKPAAPQPQAAGLNPTTRTGASGTRT